MKTGLLLLIGGACMASGILTLAMGGFGVPGGEVAQVYSQLGYDGVDNIGLTSNGMIALALCVTGACMMIGANAGAWKETGGY
ncbi:MAG: hypothetical protein VX265_06510 [Myxococcota bacterium]|nr:hypothetical protein [Myxococcota bacterium]